MTNLDTDWLAAHPLPDHATDTDKNERGRVLLAGGAAFVPGALRLTGEAALRAGAGKLQLATIERAAMALGVLVPEAAMIALPAEADGEIGASAAPILAAALADVDAFILGPGMSEHDRAAALVEPLLAAPREGLSVVLDAAAIGCAGRFADLLVRHAGRMVLTPHHGEMARLTGLDAAAIAVDPETAAREAAATFNAVIALKSAQTVIAAPDGTTLGYEGGGIGLATGGSGDVLAGIVGGLLARGAAPLVATAWAVWLHGEAGKLLAEKLGPIGFLARELLAPIPMLMRSVQPRGPLGFG